MNLKLKLNFFFKHLCLKKTNKKSLNQELNFFDKKLKLKNKHYYFTKFIINITFKKSNSFLHVINCVTNKNYFFSAKALLKKKNFQNNQLENFYKILITKFKYIKNKPIVINFFNIETNYKWFIQKISQNFFLILIKFYNKIAHNGCRLKK